MLRAIFHSALIGRRLGLGAGAGVGDQRIKIRWYDVGRGYASLFLGVVDQRIKISWYDMGRGYASLLGKLHPIQQVFFIGCPQIGNDFF